MRGTREQPAEWARMSRSLGGAPVAPLPPYPDTRAGAKARGTSLQAAAAGRRTSLVRRLACNGNPRARSLVGRSAPAARGHPVVP